MSRISSIDHQFVEYLPEQILDGVLYVSTRFTMAAHRCCCGCGTEVVTPLDPSDWRLTFDGKTVSLHPSIGNWSLDCQSHYWIREGQVIWARQWSRREIEEGRARARADKQRRFDAGKSEPPVPDGDGLGLRLRRAAKKFVARLRRW